MGLLLQRNPSQVRVTRATRTGDRGPCTHRQAVNIGKKAGAAPTFGDADYGSGFGGGEKLFFVFLLVYGLSVALRSGGTRNFFCEGGGIFGHFFFLGGKWGAEPPMGANAPCIP